MKRVLRSAIKQWAGAMPFIAPLPVEAAEEESVEDKNVGVEEPSAQDEGKNLYVVVVCACLLNMLRSDMLDCQVSCAQTTTAPVHT